MKAIDDVNATESKATKPALKKRIRVLIRVGGEFFLNTISVSNFVYQLVNDPMFLLTGKNPETMDWLPIVAAVSLFPGMLLSGLDAVVHYVEFMDIRYVTPQDQKDSQREARRAERRARRQLEKHSQATSRSTKGPGPDDSSIDIQGGPTYDSLTDGGVKSAVVSSSDADLGIKTQPAEPEAVSWIVKYKWILAVGCQVSETLALAGVPAAVISLLLQTEMLEEEGTVLRSVRLGLSLLSIPLSLWACAPDKAMADKHLDDLAARGGGHGHSHGGTFGHGHSHGHG